MVRSSILHVLRLRQSEKFIFPYDLVIKFSFSSIECNSKVAMKIREAENFLWFTNPRRTSFVFIPNTFHKLLASNYLQHPALTLSGL